MAAIVFLLSAKDLTSEIGQAILTLEFDRIRDLDTSKQTSTNIKIKINQKIKKGKNKLVRVKRYQMWPDFFSPFCLRHWPHSGLASHKYLWLEPKACCALMYWLPLNWMSLCAKLRWETVRLWSLFISLGGFSLLWLAKSQNRCTAAPSSRTSEAALGSLVRMRWKVPGLVPDATCFDVRVDDVSSLHILIYSSCPEFLTEQLCEDISATWHVPNHRPCQCGHV